MSMEYEITGEQVFDLTDEFVIILLILEDGKARNISEIEKLHNLCFELSELRVFRASRLTISNRILELRSDLFLAKISSKRNITVFKITSMGITAINKGEQKEYMKSAIDNYRKIIIAAKQKLDEED